jgi:hypothetical protein
MSSNLTWSDWTNMSSRERNDLTFLRLLRDNLITDLFVWMSCGDDEYDEELSEHLENIATQKNQHRSLDVLLEWARQRRTDTDPELWTESSIKLLSKISNHIAILEHNRIIQPILCPA